MGIPGRHQQAGGLAKDAEKYNAATKLGWRVLRYTSYMIERGDAINDVLEMIGR
jgi:very-short-patch-repair endonuclease